MLLMLCGDVESNPGPRRQLRLGISVTEPTTFPHTGKRVLCIGDSMIKYLTAMDACDPDRNYTISYDSIRVHAFRGKDTFFIQNQVKIMKKDQAIDSVVLMVGTNNITQKHINSHNFKLLYEGLINIVRAKFPNADIFVHTILDRFDRPGLLHKIFDFNQILKRLCSTYNIMFIQDFYLDNEVKVHILGRDRLHLSRSGNRILRSVIKASLNAWYYGEDSLPIQLRHLAQHLPSYAPSYLNNGTSGSVDIPVEHETGDLGLWDSDPHYGVISGDNVNQSIATACISSISRSPAVTNSVTDSATTVLPVVPMYHPIITPTVLSSVTSVLVPVISNLSEPLEPPVYTTQTETSDPTVPFQIHSAEVSTAVSPEASPAASSGALSESSPETICEISFEFSPAVSPEDPPEVSPGASSEVKHEAVSEAPELLNSHTARVALPKSRPKRVYNDDHCHGYDDGSDDNDDCSHDDQIHDGGYDEHRAHVQHPYPKVIHIGTFCGPSQHTSPFLRCTRQPDPILKTPKFINPIVYSTREIPVFIPLPVFSPSYSEVLRSSNTVTVPSSCVTPPQSARPSSPHFSRYTTAYSPSSTPAHSQRRSLLHSSRSTPARSSRFTPSHSSRSTPSHSSRPMFPPSSGSTPSHSYRPSSPHSTTLVSSHSSQSILPPSSQSLSSHSYRPTSAHSSRSRPSDSSRSVLPRSTRTIPSHSYRPSSVHPVISPSASSYYHTSTSTHSLGTTSSTTPLNSPQFRPSKSAPPHSVITAHHPILTSSSVVPNSPVHTGRDFNTVPVLSFTTPPTETDRPSLFPDNNKHVSHLKTQLLFSADVLPAPLYDEVLYEISKRPFLYQAPFRPSTILYGDCQYVYNHYSKRVFPISLDNAPSIRTALNIVNNNLGTTFNSVLVNKYDDIHCTLTWHKDDEKRLDKSTPIATLSLGAVRPFQFTTHKDKPPILSIPLPTNSLLVMDPSTQVDYFHRLHVGSYGDVNQRCTRYSLTFRRMNSHKRPIGDEQPVITAFPFMTEPMVMTDNEKHIEQIGGGGIRDFILDEAEVEGHESDVSTITSGSDLSDLIDDSSCGEQEYVPFYDCNHPHWERNKIIHIGPIDYNKLNDNDSSLNNIQDGSEPTKNALRKRKKRQQEKEARLNNTQDGSEPTKNALRLREKREKEKELNLHTYLRTECNSQIYPNEL